MDALSVTTAQPRFFSLNGLRPLATQAAEFLRQGDYEEGIRLLRQAQALNPTDGKLLLDLGLAYATTYDFAAAERCFEQAIRLAPSKTEALLVAGHQWREVRCYKAARTCFERIMGQREIPMAAFVRLAEIYERQGRLEEAEEMAERGLQQDRSHGAALLMRARVHRRMGEFAEAEKVLHSVVTQRNSDRVCSPAWYELGTILDQQGAYDEAMAAFLQAKSLLRTEGERLIGKLRRKQAMMRQAQESISEDLLQRWRSFGGSTLRPTHKLALLCGYARSGTTLLEYVLDSHPKIISADETSVLQNKIYPSLARSSQRASLLSALDSLSARQLRKMRSDYFAGMESFLGQTIGGRLLIDKNPTLTSDIPVFVRIFPESRFLVALRDPRDVCLSSFMQAAPIDASTTAWLSLEETVKDYVSMMGFWLALKPHVGGQAIEVRYEDMVDNLGAGAKRVLDFLETGWDERVLRFNEHAQSKTVCSPTYAEVSRPVYKNAVGRWKNYEKYIGPYVEALEPFLSAFGYK